MTKDIAETVLEGKVENGFDTKELRDQLASRVEVLDRVKRLMLMPKIDVLTASQIAEYYEVDIEAVRKVFKRNTVEFVEDGAYLAKSESLMGHFVPLGSDESGSKAFDIGDGRKIKVSNRGCRVFPARAILRFGMLLRDSAVAREVRTQLLNIAEKADDSLRTEDIDEEQRLMTDIGRAIMSGNIGEMNAAYVAAFSFKNHHIDGLKEALEAKDAVNRALSKQDSVWDRRAPLNALVRRYGYKKCSDKFGFAWSAWRKELLYSGGIRLERAPGRSFMDTLTDAQWPLAIAAGIRINLNSGVDVDDILAHGSDEFIKAAREAVAA